MTLIGYTQKLFIGDIISTRSYLDRFLIEKQFVKEVARLFNTYAEASPMEGKALKAVMVLPALVLQKPFRESRSKDHSKCLERRLKQWEAGQFMDLFLS